jgi:hypothetical protein
VETAKRGMPRGPSMKNINLNLTVKVCKIWCNDVYMSILQCDIFWWKLIDRNFFNPIFNTKVVVRASPFFAVSTVKGNILALIHLRVLLLNKYEISSISEYPVWR